jgi:hypothetical protein
MHGILTCEQGPTVYLTLQGQAIAQSSARVEPTLHYGRKSAIRPLIFVCELTAQGAHPAGRNGARRLTFTRRSPTYNPSPTAMIGRCAISNPSEHGEDASYTSSLPTLSSKQQYVPAYPVPNQHAPCAMLGPRSPCSRDFCQSRGLVSPTGLRSARDCGMGRQD